jgi:hypothetical protein
MFSSFGPELADKERRSSKHHNVPIEEGSGLITEVQNLAFLVDTQLSVVM